MAVSGGRTYTALVASEVHTCGLAGGGRAYCWGRNASGQLGDGTVETNRLTPVAVSGGLSFTVLAAGSDHTCGLAMGGTAYCWGSNAFGQLGGGTVGTNRLTQVAVSGGRKYTALVAGWGHTCGLAAGGRAYCWGFNAFGQLGDRMSGTGYSSADRLAPVAVSGGLSFTALAAGGAHTCGLVSGGTAYCWGNNQYGQLGDGTTGTGFRSADRTAPVVVSGGLSFTALAGGGVHTCGLLTGGSAYCWGSNASGQLGDGMSGTDRTAPVAVGAGRTFTALAGGFSHTCGLATGETGYCWGSNDSGQLGDGTSGVNGDNSADRTVPVAVIRLA